MSRVRMPPELVAFGRKFYFSCYSTSLPLTLAVSNSPKLSKLSRTLHTLPYTFFNRAWKLSFPAVADTYLQPGHQPWQGTPITQGGCMVVAVTISLPTQT